MKTLTNVLFLTLVSSAAIAGGIDYQPPVSVPEPGILGLFATAGVTLFLARKFRK